MSQPASGRPRMPAGYGVEQATVLLEWRAVESRLIDSLHYWIATTRSDGRPHTVPRWGVWLEGRFWYDGSPETLHVRNLAQQPVCSLHLESGSNVVIVEGPSLASDPIDGDLGERLSAEYARKYAPQYQPPADAWSDEIAGGMRFIEPAKALAWTDFPNDLTRFTF